MKQSVNEERDFFFFFSFWGYLLAAIFLLQEMSETAGGGVIVPNPKQLRQELMASIFQASVVSIQHAGLLVTDFCVCAKSRKETSLVFQP